MSVAAYSPAGAVAYAHFAARQRHALAPVRREPLDWARTHGTLRLPDGRLVRYAGVARGYQDDLLADTARRIIVAKSRQIGISQVAAFLVAVETLNGGSSLLVSRDQDAAARLLETVRVALDGDPGRPAYLTENTYTLTLANGGTAEAQPATRKAGRSAAATLVVLDEHAWQEYDEAIWSAILPTLATTNGRLLVLSSANGRDNLFYRLWQDAQAEDSGWSPRFLPWNVHPDWQDIPNFPALVMARDHLTAEQFAQEYAVDFLVSGQALFDPDDVAALWRLPALSPALPEHRYLTAWDIARKVDATVGITLDVSTSPYQIVAFERFTGLDYPSQARAIEDRHRAYPGTTVVESNGPGDPLIQFLPVPVDPFVTTALSKRNALDALKLLIQRRELIAPRIGVLERELLAYQPRDSGLQQDSVMALAIAALVAGTPVRSLPPRPPTMAYYRR